MLLPNYIWNSLLTLIINEHSSWYCLITQHKFVCLVSTPDGEVDIPFVQLKFNVANGMGKIPTWKKMSWLRNYKTEGHM